MSPLPSKPTPNNLSGDTKDKYINRELTWLRFNGRVLQEAKDSTVPVLTRIKFLGIFSNNLDEFFRVRVASLKRIVEINQEAKMTLGFSPKKILREIYRMVISQQRQFEEIYNDIKLKLAQHQIFIIDERQLSPKQGEKVRAYFHSKVRHLLVPLMINNIPTFPRLKDGSIYLAVRLTKQKKKTDYKYALIELPNKISRFFVFKPEENEAEKYVMLLDDVIRYCLQDIFNMLGYTDCQAYTVKITKDAETDLDTDVSKSFLELMSIAISKRKLGRPVRFIHDKDIDKGLLNFLVNRMNIDAKEDSVIAGGRYHNSKDFMGFPNLGTNELRDTKRKPLSHPDIDPKKSLFKMIRKKDIMLHFPYQSFHPIIDFLREAAIDPKVEYIKVTIYRLAKQSNIINALINARKNGKKVTAAIELQARFDEAANIAWAKTLQENGIKVVHGQPGQKIHSKILLVGRRERGKIKSYVSIGTGNFHEGTAKLYSDDNLLTSNSKITKEVERVFRMIETGIPEKFKHLLVSPHDMYPKLLGFIDTEIANAKAGKEAYLLAKLNSLNDEGMIDKLYEASQAGVKIRLIIRGICCLLPERTGLSENIEAISIVDKYLEHSRCYIFCNGGDEKVFISSADWMERNLHRRIEVSCPIYDPQIKSELKKMLSIQLQDNTKARWINHERGVNIYKHTYGKSVRAQDTLYQYFQEKLKPSTETNDDKDNEGKQ